MARQQEAAPRRAQRATPTPDPPIDAWAKSAVVVELLQIASGLHNSMGEEVFRRRLERLTAEQRAQVERVLAALAGGPVRS